MKHTIIIALAIGALISAALLVIEPLTDFAFLSLEWPGISAAYVFWGAVGGPAFMGVALAWAVNALAYGLGTFGLFSALMPLMSPRTC
ncbi:hypothetical protein [Bradyrhizobium sp. 1]|uniref:hypothetical protein n=1 Tax=Bradyrhizobium sp. 1 TaxID=241591 RepID=UPI001FF7A273|nr:hypothetical protein [Bradyrhizobium sp. 1]MCK1396000.1 hypothetical protein [Bradyrhizobium sp. 1]